MAEGPQRKSAMGAMTPGMTSNSAAVNRSIGAMIYALFGGAWIAYAAWHSLASPAWALALDAVLAACLFGYAYVRYQRLRQAFGVEPETPANQRRDRWFHIINAGQWIVVLIVGNVLDNIGLSTWVIPAAMFIIGLHFLPLARLFGSTAHFFTGAGFLALAVLYPFACRVAQGVELGLLGRG